MYRYVFFIVLPPFIIAASPGKDTLRIKWENKIGVNASLQSGNSSTLGVGGNLKINRNNPWKNEWTFTASGMYRKDREEVIIQSAETALRFAWSINRKLYNFYRLAFYHNKINRISGQLLPTLGVGYWCSDTKALKLLLETGGGFNGVAYYGDSASKAATFQARIFVEYHLLDNLTLGNNTYYFPGWSMQLVKSSSYFTLKAERLSAKFELSIDFNSRPISGLKKADLQLKSGVEYSF